MRQPRAGASSSKLEKSFVLVDSVWLGRLDLFEADKLGRIEQKAIAGAALRNSSRTGHKAFGKLSWPVHSDFHSMLPADLAAFAAFGSSGDRD